MALSLYVAIMNTLNHVPQSLTHLPVGMQGGDLTETLELGFHPLGLDFEFCGHGAPLLVAISKAIRFDTDADWRRISWIRLRSNGHEDHRLRFAFVPSLLAGDDRRRSKLLPHHTIIANRRRPELLAH